jgi:polyhydroxyalkanoate synthesis regulator phasin
MPDNNAPTTSKSASPAAAKPATASPRSTSSAKTGAARKPAARKPASRAKSTTAAKPPARSTGSRSTAAKAPASRSTASRSTARKRATAAKPGTSAAAPATAARPAAKSGDPLRAGLTRVRDLVGRGIVVSRDRIQDTMDDAVKRGRLVRRDADELTERLVSSGRQQTQDILADIEQLLGRGREQVGTATKTARVRATRRSDAVLREVDKARRRAGIGSFPVLGYDDLTAEQIVKRLADLSPAELRKVRDYELRHGNRKSVLSAIERKLG